MSIKLKANINNPPIGGLATAYLINETVPVEIVWGNETQLEFPDGRPLFCYTINDVLRALARAAPAYKLYGETAMERTVVDHWLSFSLSCGDTPSAISIANQLTAPVTYLVGNKLTIADFALFNEIYPHYQKLAAQGMPEHIQRWYNLISAHPVIEKVLQSLPETASFAEKATKPVNNAEKESTPIATKTGGRKQEGKFVDLPGAEMGKVVVRFPPEASGYLHIGHAKAALLNQYYAQAFNGKLIMRFDDTNPAKETTEFEEVILGDLELLQIKPDMFTHTSNYFDLMLQYCEQLIKEGKAYADDTPPEQMKVEREQRIESKNRSNDVEKNMSMWKEMVNGTEYGQTCCVRAKIDMSSANGCMRDPTIYRCKNEPHPRTGTKYKVYPTYDFACPIVDAIEGVTHTLRTTEYHDRDDQFYWFIDALKLRKPHIWEYSRLNMTNTVLSKRKLTWFVESGLVDGWDDPRFPTVRGIIRRGMTVEGLKEFIIAQGSSKSVVFMDWDKIWAFNRKVIDPIVPRYTALNNKDQVVVIVEDVKYERVEVPIHPKNKSLGTKCITYAREILIDYADAVELVPGEMATFINWGNLLIKDVNLNKDGKQSPCIHAKVVPDNKDFKNTQKVSWIAKEPQNDYTPTVCVYFDHIISKAVLGKNEDFKQYIGHETRKEEKMLGEHALKNCKKGDIIQLQRRGFFKVDEAYAPPSPYTGVETPLILFSIPDGHTKDKPTTGSKPSKEQNSSTNAIIEGVDLDLQVFCQHLTAALAPKEQKQAETNKLNSLLKTFKQIRGVNWVAPQSSDLEVPKLIEGIQKLSHAIEELKERKEKEIKTQEQFLQQLKACYKKKTSHDWPPVIKGEKSPEPPQPSDVSNLSAKIVAQGDKIRQLKATKANKDTIKPEVDLLLALKADYKSLTGKEWTPNQTEITTSAAAPVRASATTDTNIDVGSVLEKIKTQGDKIRKLKAEKAAKDVITPEVQELLSLKAEYKKLTGIEWTPDAKVESASAPVKACAATDTNIDVGSVLEKIKAQGDKIRKLKAEKAAKDVITPEVQELLSLKAEYKKLTGVEWTPDAKVESAPASKTVSEVTMSTSPEKELLTKEINAQGEKVRAAKASNIPKEEIDIEVKKLLVLKAKYKEVTGTDFPVAARGGSSGKKSSDKKEAKATPVKKEAPSVAKADAQAGGVKKQTRLGLEATKEDNLPDWYSQVITKGELIEYYDVSGCYILRPWSFAIWKHIKNWFDAEITKRGVKECYFPIFVSKAALEKEKAHIADFAPEVAWVTKSGESDLAEPIAVRPTSETVMYPALAKWVQSYRDLPIRLNQWNNVVRWEFKHPQPFLRTREFLWQEGHTAFASKTDAEAEVLEILDLYARVYTNLLAIPVVKGRKTEKEKFAGSNYTTTVEAFVSASGRGIQGATSHHLGQNFSKMFEIVFEDPETQQKQYAYQNSWGMTTRTIGVMIMVHADNQGLVLPPHVACIQAIIVPCGITVNTKDDEREQLLEACKKLEAQLCTKGIRCEGDYRDNYSPGWKFNHWELKGVPLRIEVGPKDMRTNQIVAVRRDTGEKLILALEDVESKISQLLETIHDSMLAKARADLVEHTKVTKNWADFCRYLDMKNLLLSPFCGEIPCEDKIKADSAKDEDAEPGAPAMGAKALCIPFDQPATISGSDKCIHPNCTNKPQYYTLFGRSY